MKYIDYEKQVQYDTLSKAAIRNKALTETLSEEMRILYVALTRAKEKLIISGIQKDFKKQKEKLLQQIQRYQKQEQKINPILVKKYKKYIDWILLVYFYQPKQMETIAELKIHTKKEILDFCEKREEQDVNLLEILDEHKIGEQQIAEIESMLQNTYAYELSTKIPTKSSVTKLKQQEQETIEISFPSPKFTKQDEELKLTGAEKGTLLHLCMQKLDEKTEYTIEKVKEFIKGMVDKEMITSKEADNINTTAILKFTQSNIWHEMKQAKEIQKEKPFYITLPAKEIYEEDVPENILVQGIIDLYYVNAQDELILVDYKTDFVPTEQELVNKYKTQLALYRRALEEALQKKVSHVFIYSTCLAKEIEI